MQCIFPVTFNRACLVISDERFPLEDDLCPCLGLEAVDVLACPSNQPAAVVCREVKLIDGQVGQLARGGGCRGLDAARTPPAVTGHLGRIDEELCKHRNCGAAVQH